MQGVVQRRTLLVVAVALGVATTAAAIAYYVRNPPAGPTPAPTSRVAKGKQLPKLEARTEINLFFADSGGRGLVATATEIIATGQISTEAEQALNLLLAGPTPDIEDRLPIAPPGVTLRGLYLDGKGTAFVDLAGLAGQQLGGTYAELLFVYAITDTLAYSFPADVRRVRLLLDGQEVSSLGHVSIENALVPRRDLVLALDE